MKRKLKEELVRMSTDIITSRNLNDINDLYEAAKGLYEKLAILKYIDQNLKEVEVDVSKNAIASKFETMATAVLNENKSVPESNPHEEDIITPGMDTIKDMVSEMRGNVPVDEVFAEFLAKPEFLRKEKEPLGAGGSNANNQEIKFKSLNDKLNKDIKLDLNDRLVFLKHLFNDSAEDLNRVLSQLNTIDSEERSVAFIVNMVKPDYNNWIGKELYEARFMALIQRKFS